MTNPVRGNVPVFAVWLIPKNARAQRADNQIAIVVLAGGGEKQVAPRRGTEILGVPVGFAFLNRPVEDPPGPAGSRRNQHVPRRSQHPCRLHLQLGRGNAWIKIHLAIVIPEKVLDAVENQMSPAESSWA